MGKWNIPIHLGYQTNASASSLGHDPLIDKHHQMPEDCQYWQRYEHSLFCGVLTVLWLGLINSPSPPNMHDTF